MGVKLGYFTVHNRHGPFSIEDSLVSSVPESLRLDFLAMLNSSKAYSTFVCISLSCCSCLRV